MMRRYQLDWNPSRAASWVVVLLTAFTTPPLREKRGSVTTITPPTTPPHPTESTNERSEPRSDPGSEQGTEHCSEHGTEHGTEHGSERCTEHGPEHRNRCLHSWVWDELWTGTQRWSLGAGPDKRVREQRVAQLGGNDQRLGAYRSVAAAHPLMCLLQPFFKTDCWGEGKHTPGSFHTRQGVWDVTSTGGGECGVDGGPCDRLHLLEQL